MEKKYKKKESSTEIEPIIWLIFSIIVFLFSYVMLDGPIFKNDSYQYLSVAENIYENGSISSSIVHYDEQYNFKKIPAPMTVFPPGYSILIAFLKYFNIQYYISGWIISAVCYFVILYLLFLFSKELNLSKNISRIMYTFFILNGTTLIISNSILSESLFLMLSMLSIILFIKSETNYKSRTDFIIIANIIACIGFYVRYAGIFLITAINILYLFRYLISRDRSALKIVYLNLISVIFILVCLFRNLVLSSTITGGNTKSVNRSMSEMISKGFSSIFHLIFGDSLERKNIIDPGVLELILFASSIYITLLIVYIFMKNYKRNIFDCLEQTHNIIVVYIFIYIIGLFILGKFTMISFGEPRYMYPVFPLILMVFLSLINTLIINKIDQSKIIYKIFPLAVAAFIISYAAINMKSVHKGHTKNPHDVITQYLNYDNIDGTSLIVWINDNIDADDVVISENGQPLQYFLKRKTLSLVGTEFSNQIWNIEKVRDLQLKYNARFFVNFYNSENNVKKATDSNFLASLLKGEKFDWLKLEIENKYVKIYRFVDADSSHH